MSRNEFQKCTSVRSASSHLRSVLAMPLACFSIRSGFKTRTRGGDDCSRESNSTGRDHLKKNHDKVRFLSRLPIRTSRDVLVDPRRGINPEGVNFRVDSRGSRESPPVAIARWGGGRTGGGEEEGEPRDQGGKKATRERKERSEGFARCRARMQRVSRRRVDVVEPAERGTIYGDAKRK